MQKISIKFAVVIGVSIARICLYFIRNDTKNTSLLQLFEHFSYVELTQSFFVHLLLPFVHFRQIIEFHVGREAGLDESSSALKACSLEEIVTEKTVSRTCDKLPQAYFCFLSLSQIILAVYV